MSLINDILDLSKIEAGRLSLNLSDFNLHLLLDDLTKVFSLRAEAKGLRMQLVYECTVPTWVHGDDGKLRQVLMNLLGNALKFTPAGGSIVLRAGVNGDTKSTWFEVEDTGTGISEEEKALLFQPFQQAEAGRKSGGGTGLGLNISQRLLDLMGGTIHLQSTPRQGCCFHVELPLQPAENTVTSKRTANHTVSVASAVSPMSAASHIIECKLPANSPPIRLLVADDILDNRRLLMDVLTPSGFIVLEANNGAEAVAMCMQHRPHAVLMDIRMPVMDGCEATRRIKASATGADIPIIAVSASALAEDKQAILDCGADAYISKPVEASILFNTLQELLHLQYETVIRPHPVSLKNLCASIPEAIRRNLYQAIEQGDTTRCDSYLETLHLSQPIVAQALQKLVNDFEYDTLQQLLG